MNLAEQLRILSIFHYVVGGLYALFGSLGLIHFGMGLFILFSPKSFGSGLAEPPLAVGAFFAAIGGIFVLGGWTLGILTALSGRYIAQRKKRTFSIVLGAINCALVPLGTVLGVFDIILLSKEETRDWYGEAPSNGSSQA